MGSSLGVGPPLKRLSPVTSRIPTHLVEMVATDSRIPEKQAFLGGSPMSISAVEKLCLVVYGQELLLIARMICVDGGWDSIL
jgi:hypothetical protein